jgi:4-hydroxybenzoate polyprenyltransferase
MIRDSSSMGSGLKEYGKLARLFNMPLTGMGPVFGALAMGLLDPLRLLALFILGCGAHIYGFVLNDVVDVRVDKKSKELGQRPLVSGTISIRGGYGFAISGLLLMLVLGIIMVFPDFKAYSILCTAALLATIYNFISKKIPGMDFFVAGAVGVLTLFGSATVSTEFTTLAYVIAFLAFFQVMFMNIVAGGLKDIDHDSAAGGRTLAVAMGCRVNARARNKLIIPVSFKAMAHMIELIFILLVIGPFIFAIEGFETNTWQTILILFLSIAMFGISSSLMRMPRFVRADMRKMIGLHYSTNFSLVPVMLSVTFLPIIILALVPPVGFALANLALHGSAAKPETM